MPLAGGVFVFTAKALLIFQDGYEDGYEEQDSD